MDGWRRLGLATVLVAAAVLSGCYSEMAEPPDRAVIQPSYVFALGVRQDDVQAMLGQPSDGPRYDRASRTTLLVYHYPFQAIQAESRSHNGMIRAEMVDTIYLFFDSRGVLIKMGSWVNRWYPSEVDVPVQRITVLPRVVHAPWGVVTPVRPP